MSWDGVYSKDREYPIFKIGDEVIPLKKYKSLSKESYIVIDCYCEYKHIPNHPQRVVKLISDYGNEQIYSSYNFTKSNAQIRHDKIKLIINEV